MLTKTQFKWWCELSQRDREYIIQTEYNLRKELKKEMEEYIKE